MSELSEVSYTARNDELTPCISCVPFYGLTNYYPHSTDNYGRRWARISLSLVSVPSREYFPSSCIYDLANLNKRSKPCMYICSVVQTAGSACDAKL